MKLHKILILLYMFLTLVACDIEPGASIDLTEPNPEASPEANSAPDLRPDDIFETQ